MEGHRARQLHILSTRLMLQPLSQVGLCTFKGADCLECKGFREKKLFSFMGS